MASNTNNETNFFSLNISKEEKLNTLSHGIGVLLGVIGFFVLLTANENKTPYSMHSIVVYGVSVLLLFTASTLYHSVSDITWKKKLRILDHISIYILIAGTYTPMCLITLVDGRGWTIFFMVWGIAIAGTFLKLFFTGKYEIISLLLYVLMGWLIVFDLNAVLTEVSLDGQLFLLLGGLFYTLGIVFYAIKRIPYNHFIWHLFVLGGAISHWFLILDISS